MSRYLEFRKSPGGETKVIAKKTGAELGHLEYNLGWSQMVFAPRPGTIWSWGCLADVEAELKKLNKEAKGSRPAREGRIE